MVNMLRTPLICHFRRHCEFDCSRLFMTLMLVFFYLFSISISLLILLVLVLDSTFSFLHMAGQLLYCSRIELSSTSSCDLRLCVFAVPFDDFSVWHLMHLSWE